MSHLIFDKRHGPLVGEVTETEAVVWYRDEDGYDEIPVLQYWSRPHKADLRVKGIDVDPYADWTSKTKLTNLQPSTRYFYDIQGRQGSFLTAGSKACQFVFGSCVGGQGYGRYTEDHEDGEGFPIFNAMAKLRPDFIQIQGDFIYADNIIEAESTGRFHNGQRFLTPGNAKVLPVATDLDSFRARYKYNLEDPALGNFLRNTVVFNTWDDHEIFDDFGQDRLNEEGKAELFKCGEAVFHEYWPLEGPPEEPYRIYRSMTWGPNVEMFILDTRSYRARHQHEPGSSTPPVMKHMLGEAQKKWLLEGLRASTRTWKFIATSVPLSYPTGWPRPEETGYDGWSDGNWDRVSGPEVELLEILACIRDHQIPNVVFLSGDVHFPFCISYDPFEDGEPLVYEIGATPFHALCLPVPERGPDNTFRPTVLYSEGRFADQSLLNFGHVVIDNDANFKFVVRDKVGKSMYELKLKPKS